MGQPLVHPAAPSTTHWWIQDRYGRRTALQDGPANGGLDTQEYYRQLLRLVYRLLFLFVAEDRSLLLLRGEEREAARLRYISE